ncbi:MAG: RluA family pseudouridine synthase [Pedobacter sp.]
MAGHVFRISVDTACNGMRLDQFLAQALPDFSRTFARKIIDLGGVHLDGRRMRRSSVSVAAGASLEVFLDDQDLQVFTLTDEHILYRDNYLLVINKPAGINSQPTPARYKGTLYEALLRMLESPYAKGQKPSLGMVQRLDRDTSGVMVFSIHTRAHQPLSKIFTDRGVQKIYLAMIEGTMDKPQGEFRSMLARQHRTNLMKSVEKGGKEALTRYRVIESFGDATLVEVEIPTGRSHQIRVHFSEAGHPLLGDTRYGGAASWRGIPVARQMLHAWKLQMKHPVSRESVAFEAPYPSDLLEMLNRARLSGDAASL